MSIIKPRWNFDFEVIEPGIYKFVTGEAGIDPPKEGKKTGKRFWVICKAMDGGQEGKTHIESFYEYTKDDFSLSRMAGFLVKIGVLKNVTSIDSEIFHTPDFELKWKNSVPNREFGAKITHRTKDADGKPLDNPQSEMRVYYTLSELSAERSKGKAKDSQDLIQLVQKEEEEDMWA